MRGWGGERGELEETQILIKITNKKPHSDPDDWALLRNPHPLLTCSEHPSLFRMGRGPPEGGREIRVLDPVELT